MVREESLSVVGGGLIGCTGRFHDSNGHDITNMEGFLTDKKRSKITVGFPQGIRNLRIRIRR